MFIYEGNSIRITALWKINTKRGTHASEPRSYYSLAFKLSGASVYKCDNITYTANAGDIIFYPKGRTFTHKHDDTQIFMVNFECSEELKPNNFEVFSVKSPETFKSMFMEMEGIWQKRERGSMFHVTSIFYKILHMLCNEVSNQDMEKPIPKTQLIREYIMRHYTDQGFSIAGLSETFSTSESYLRRVFQAEFGMSPKRYVLSLRLSQAENLLKSGYFQITEVANRCGFANQKYFSNVFRQELGMSPSQYVRYSKAGMLSKEIRLE